MSTLRLTLVRGIKTAWQILVELVYPRLCAVCQTRLASCELAICTHCALGLRHYEPDLISAHERLYSSPRFARLYALYTYERETCVQQLIGALKYHGHTDVACLVGQVASEVFARQWGEYDLIIAVPIESSHLAKRGYNQALLVARELSKSLGIEASDCYIRRLKGSHSQTHLSKSERMQNVASAFVLDVTRSQALCGKRILLVDDVLTTGSTLLAMCSLLEQAGVEQIDVFVCAVAV